MKRYINDGFKKFLHGGDYSPEQWLNYDGVIDEDMRLMKLAKCNEMSVGIFSWAMLEPKENVYNFKWLDEVLDKIYANGGRVFLATPSGARPHWLADKYPEVLRVSSNGVRNKFGERHNHCLSSPYYRKKVAEINSKLAERYGKHPAVIGWHISNEYNGECFCDICIKEYREWLKKEYDNDIEKLNYQWYNTFWSLRYDSFDQVLPPFQNGEKSNPAVLNWKRFITSQTASFIKNEVQAIRKYSDLPVTTNFMAHFGGLDYYEIAKELDFISWDSYPYCHKPGEEGHYYSMAEHASMHDFCRALKDKPFILMESAPGCANWHDFAKLKKPGMLKLASMQAIAHGSDSVLYFQWRKGRGNRESHHGAIVDHVGNENTRVFKEVTEIGETLEKISEVVGTSVQAEVAVVLDVENRWAIDNARGYAKNKSYNKTCYQFYNELHKRAINVDVISARMDISKYKLVIAPMMYSMRKEVIDNFINYVNNGGTLVSGYMTGSVNENDLFYLKGLPANGLKDVFGVWAEEVDVLYPEERNYIESNGKKYEVADFCERIHPLGNAKVLATYYTDFYAGEPAVVKNKYGKGTAYYIAARDTGEYKDYLIGKILEELNISGNIPNPSFGVTAHTRTDGENTY